MISSLSDGSYALMKPPLVRAVLPTLDSVIFSNRIVSVLAWGTAWTAWTAITKSPLACMKYDVVSFSKRKANGLPAKTLQVTAPAGGVS